MSLTVDVGSRRMTSDRHDVINDTGRIAFCGPFVISAVTGYGILRIEDEIRRIRHEPEDSETVVKGTYSEEVSEVLEHFGYTMKPTRTYLHLPRKQRPSVWSWMQFPRNAWAHYILAVHKGKQGHWILIKGVKLLDTYSQGKWEFVCDGPHKGARIMEIFEVRRALD
jgi:hypothetical protein